MTTTSNPTRRSARSRQQPKSYSESPRSKEEQEEEDRMDVTDDASSSDKDDNEDFEPDAKKQNAKSSSPTFSKMTPSENPSGVQKVKKRTIKVQASNTTTAAAAAKKPKGRKAIHSALNALSKKVLEESETPETSLVAALLASSKPIPGIPSSTPRTIGNGETNAVNSTNTVTLYTPQLEGIARHLLQQHEPNSLHIQLLNFLFRSVGGSGETNLEDGTDLEEMDDSEWDSLVTEVVEVMRENDDPLLCANPKDCAKEYRDIYREFWYRLGNVVLTHSQGGEAFTSNRFQVEMVRELVARITELVLVGQPDMRAGATIAVLQLAIACIERTIELDKKLQVATRQYKAAGKNQSRKLQTLQHSMDAWKRHKAELEEIVEGPVFQGVFIHRYRDSNPYIRQISLQALSQLTILRPDLFLRDKYLKYFGWMASDKVALVRLEALKGLYTPFQQAMWDKKNPKKSGSSLAVEIGSMQNVCTKFLNRIVDCTEDSGSMEVQETAMELLLAMLREEFLDEWDDDNGWDQVNLKSLDPNTTPKVRMNALYFILEQLDSFDADGDSKSVSEKKQVEQIEGIASWIAHHLCDGPISIDKIRVQLADHIIRSLREMPEHKHLVVNWSAMLKAIKSENPQQDRPGREEVAKQRVMLRMLACAAETEVGESPESTKQSNKKRKRDLSNHPLETLSLALLKSLPHLLTAFKGDVLALRSLTKLPQYLTPSAFSLPARKNDFQQLVKNLTKLFLESTDEECLENMARTMVILIQDDHTRVADVKMQLKRLSTTLQDRLMELLRESDPQTTKSLKRRSSRKSDSSTVSSGTLSSSAGVDVEHSIHFCLLRWRVLLKTCPAEYLFQDDEDNDEVDGFCETIAEAIGQRLIDRKLISEEGENDNDDEKTEMTSFRIPDIWKNVDASIHPVVADTVDEGLQVLLLVVSWKLLETLRSRRETFSTGEDNDDSHGMEEDMNDEDLIVLNLRERLVKLLAMCFDQYLIEMEGLVFSDEHVEFANSVQSSAGRIASDIRTLFPRDWKEAKDPVRRKLALTEDSQLIGGFARYLQSRESELVEQNDSGSLVNELLMPLARGITANWNDGNRREASIVLNHITGSGSEAGHTVQAMARLLKKINPVRFLESQMTCLRIAFENWVNNEPGELESDRPTEEELLEFEEAEKQHAELFHSMEQLAARLSQSLGVGRLTDQKLSRALLSFVQEGVRFAFEGNRNDKEDDLVLGSRLPFLLVLSKYSNWIKKNKSQLEVLKDFIYEKESTLRTHPEFDEVHEDDLSALRSFKESLGMKEGRRNQNSHTQDEYSAPEEQPSAIATPSPGAVSSSSRPRISTASSQRSRMSAQSTLSPLYEEDGASDNEGRGVSPSPPKQRRLARSMSSVTKEKIAKTHNRIDEEDENQESDAEMYEN